MPTRNVVLTHHQEVLIAALVQSGRYQNGSEVLDDGLHLLEIREATDAVKLEALRAAAALGAAALDRGEFTEFQTAAALANHLNTVAGRTLSGSEAE